MSSDSPRKIASEVYDHALEDSGSDGFELGDVIQAIGGELRIQQLGDDIIDDYARKLGKAEDDRRAREIENYQGNLFTGEVEALRAPLRLEDGHDMWREDLNPLALPILRKLGQPTLADAWPSAADSA